MTNDIYKKTIKSLPSFFDNNIQSDNSGGEIFKKVKELVDFDQAYIFYLNPDSIQLKYLYRGLEHFRVEDIFYINDSLKNELFTSDNFLYEKDSKLTNLLTLEGHSFLLSKLMIKNTVFGFVLLCSDKKSNYSSEDLEILGAISSVISYTIKDIELSNIFRIQLKALKEGLLETSAANKIIKEQNIKILETDKVKSEFLANVSHELRTPLNSIIGFSEVLSTQFYGELNKKQEEYVEDIRVSGIHLLGMINEILDISKIEANAMNLNRTKFMLSMVVGEVMNIVMPLSDKKSIVMTKNIINDGEVFADYQKISQILYNLLSNAIKFSPEKGTIEVSIDVTAEKFTLTVKDNGIGIDEKYHSAVFSKFVQLESAYTKNESSTGLGLTITKQLVEMHDGKISLNSSLNNGATFIVEIPNN